MKALIGTFNYFKRHPSRYPELQNAMILVLLGVQYCIGFWALENSDSYHAFEDIGIDRLIAVWIGVGIGVLRIVALIVNGSWRKSPAVRGAGASLSAGFFIMIALSHNLPIAMLAVTDVISAYKAGTDARSTLRK